jgi:protein TonB
MFASVRNIPRRSFGTGTFLSLAAHAVLIAIAMSTAPRPEPPPKLVEMKFVTASPRPRPATPLAAGAPATPQRTASAAHVSAAMPRSTRRSPSVDTPIDRSGAQPGANDTLRGSDAPGDGAPGVEGPRTGSGPGTAPATEVIPFGRGMEPPRLVSQTEITFSARAWAEKVGGVALAQCVLELDGTLSHCRITHGLPYMDEPILGALRGWRYTPVLYQGHPQRVLLTIPVRVPRPS